MTRRTRILTALDGGMPDRPPIAFDSRPGAMHAVLEHYGARTKNDLYLNAGIDGFSVWEWNAVMGEYAGPVKTAADGTMLDFWGNASQTHFGLAYCETPSDIEKHPWPDVGQFDFSRIREQARAIKSKDMVVSAGHMGLGYQMHNMLRGNENALFDVMDDDFMQAYMARLSEFSLEYLDALLTTGAGEIDVVRADDDLGTMDRLMVSPATWRRYYKPAWQRAFDLCHRHGARVWFHCCGHIAPLLEDLVEIGVDCWNPFPPYVAGNDHVRLAQWRQGRLSLDGGVSHLVLVQGTPEDVADETNRVLDLFGPQGGLLIGPSQVVTEDMPPANVIAMFDTALEWGRKAEGCRL